jgi:RNA polymerase sigma-70 factor, ECF subfamily
MFLIVLPDTEIEDDLLFRLRRGEEEAVIATYEHFFSPLYQYVRLKVGDRALAQDIVSEVFVKLIECQGKPSAPRYNLRGWLFRVARNTVYRNYSKARPLSLNELEEWMPAPPESNPEIRLGDIVDMERVRHALRMLKADHQEVLILRFGQRLSLKETADIMGKSVAAIKSLQFRAVDTLRLILLEPNTEVSNG